MQEADTSWIGWILFWGFIATQIVFVVGIISAGISYRRRVAREQSAAVEMKE